MHPARKFLRTLYNVSYNPGKVLVDIIDSRVDNQVLSTSYNFNLAEWSPLSASSTAESMEASHADQYHTSYSVAETFFPIIVICSESRTETCTSLCNDHFNLFE